jgi:hypothetical protein
MKGSTGDTMTETQMEKAKRQYEQAKARLYATKARETKLARKRDTRRKVILGGALIELSDRDEPARSVMRRLIGNLSREQDRKMFDPREALPAIDESGNHNERTETSSNGQPHETEGGAQHG